MGKARHSVASAFLFVAALLLVSVPLVGFAETGEDEEFQEQRLERGPQDGSGRDRRWQGEGVDGPGRRSLESMNREELEEAGFLFEDTLTDRRRAHATVFALTAGAVVHGAGHWQLDDRRTALFLLGMEAVGLSLIAGGVVLALNPTGFHGIDERRRDLWHAGIGVLAMSWLIDIFGTAFRDDLGVPPSTSREIGWAVGLNYEYWRPRDLSLRHLSAATLTGKGRHFQIEGRTAQELGYGASDYQLTGRWYPFVGSSEGTRLGVELSGRYLQYRLDNPFERGDLGLVFKGSLNLGRLFAHLDQMTAGLDFGVGLRGYRFIDSAEGMGALRYGGWYLPMRIYLALNLTEQLRLEAAMERWQGSWLERSRNRLGVPVLALSYRSTDRLDLHFFSAFGDGLALGAGLQFWFRE